MMDVHRFAPDPPPPEEPLRPNPAPELGFFRVGVLFGLFLCHLVLNPFWKCDECDEFFIWVVIAILHLQFLFLNEFPPLLLKLYNKTKAWYRSHVPNARCDNEQLDDAGHFLVGWGFQYIFDIVWIWINCQASCMRLDTCDQNKNFGHFFQIILPGVNSVPEDFRFLTRQIHWFLFYGVLRIFKFCFPQVFSCNDVRHDHSLGLAPHNAVTFVHPSPLPRPQPPKRSHINIRSSQLSEAVSPVHVPFAEGVGVTELNFSPQLSIPSTPISNYVLEDFCNVTSGVTTSPSCTHTRQEDLNSRLPIEGTRFPSNAAGANGFSTAALMLSLQQP